MKEVNTEGRKIVVCVYYIYCRTQKRNNLGSYKALVELEKRRPGAYFA